VFRQQPDGTRKELPAVRVSSGSGLSPVDFLSAVSFLTDIPLETKGRPERQLVAESDADHKRLAELGATEIHVKRGAQPIIRNVNAEVVPQSVEALLPNVTGTRLYADALRLNEDVAKYREFWRVLESAFCMRENALVNALAKYQPAKELGFTEDELSALRDARGGASHAVGSGGLAQIVADNQMARERLPRLKTLVERVIVTKQNWGTPDLRVRELIPVAGYVKADGTVVLITGTPDNDAPSGN